jgi:sirohydrochlorin cobaltochelatase
MNIPIVITAFGTTSRALETYSFIDQHIKGHFPDHEIVWAYSSRMVKDFIKKRRNIDLKHPHQVLLELKHKGYSWAVVQSLHLLNGHEFYRLVEETRRCDIRTSMGLPLLTDPEDLIAMVDTIGSCYDGFKNEIAILIGHGTDHPTWSSYLALHHFFRERFGPRVFVSVVEGYPSREDIISAVKGMNVKSVRLIPFMIVAGTHMKEDIAGGEDSWKEAFERENIQVILEEKGLGFNPYIIDIFCRHIQNALEVIPLGFNPYIIDIFCRHIQNALEVIPASSDPMDKFESNIRQIVL